MQEIAGAECTRDDYQWECDGYYHPRTNLHRSDVFFLLLSIISVNLKFDLFSCASRKDLDFCYIESFKVAT